jgi:hypothetical protein
MGKLTFTRKFTVDDLENREVEEGIKKDQKSAGGEVVAKEKGEVSSSFELFSAIF